MDANADSTNSEYLERHKELEPGPNGEDKTLVVGLGPTKATGARSMVTAYPPRLETKGAVLWGAAQSRPTAPGGQSAFARVPVTESDPVAPNAKQNEPSKRRLVQAVPDGKPKLTPVAQGTCRQVDEEMAQTLFDLPKLAKPI